MYNVDILNNDLEKKLDNYCLESLNSNPCFEPYGFLKDLLLLMGKEFEDDVHKTFAKNPEKVTAIHGQEGLPDGVSYVWDLGAVVGINFGDFEVNYWQLGEYLTKNGCVKKRVIYL